MLRAHGVPARREVMPGKAGTEAWLRVGEGRAAVRYAVEVVRTLTQATLGGVLLRLRERGIAFVDLAGNAWLHQPGVMLQVAGRRPQRAARAERPARVFHPGGLRVVFALLCRPQLVDAPVREIAAAAGVAHEQASGYRLALAIAGSGAAKEDFDSALQALDVLRTGIEDIPLSP